MTTTERRPSHVPGSVAAVELDGHRVEYHAVDIATSYARLAAFVAEAAAFTRLGRFDLTEIALEKARAIVEVQFIATEGPPAWKINGSEVRLGKIWAAPIVPQKPESIQTIGLKVFVHFQSVPAAASFAVSLSDVCFDLESKPGDLFQFLRVSRPTAKPAEISLNAKTICCTFDTAHAALDFGTALSDFFYSAEAKKFEDDAEELRHKLQKLDLVLSEIADAAKLFATPGSRHHPHSSAAATCSWIFDRVHKARRDQ